MRVLGENTGLRQFFGKISADDVHSVQAHDRVDNGRGRKILAEQFRTRLGFALSAHDRRHVEEIIDMRIRGDKMPGNNSQDDIVMTL